jgi:hypothetical protein
LAKSGKEIQHSKAAPQHGQLGADVRSYQEGRSCVSIAVEREEICGDAWEVIETAGSLRAMVVDGLGHGPFAGEAAREALAVFRSQATTSG